MIPNFNNQITIELFHRKPGGQTVGTSPIGMKVTHNETGISINVPADCAGSYYSQHKLRTKLLTLLELTVEEVLKQ